mmetsp:Transcript_15449/g.19297  ORF Transcript_15449/g.19297 Transcript_15449/m.19297 type:complete len:166 (-) Transcript_15449:1102-1599(-)
MGPIKLPSPDTKVNINAVPKQPRVMATLIAPAKHKHATGTGTLGKKKHNALPKPAPAAKNGKMNPPLYPPARAREIEIILQTPTIKALFHDVISKFIKPDVGKTFSSSFAGAMVAICWNSSSPQNIVCGINMPMIAIPIALIEPLQTAYLLSNKLNQSNTSTTLQ